LPRYRAGSLADRGYAAHTLTVVNILHEQIQWRIEWQRSELSDCRCESHQQSRQAQARQVY
jgi:hypothetical protein